MLLNLFKMTTTNNDVVASAVLSTGPAARSSENQSGGTLTQTKMVNIPEVQHQTMVFAQEVSAVDTSIDSVLDSTYSDGGTSSEAGLGEFLARPVQLDLGGSFKSLSWAVSAGTVGTSLGVIDPWTLWQANPKVKQKLSNFAYLKGVLKVRIVVAGTPFHYGRIQVTYVPYAASNTILSQLITQAGSSFEGPTMYLSTGMRTEIDPTTSTPVEMSLPFSHFKNWMDVSVPETLGSLYLRELVPLTRANNTAADSVAITMFVWLEQAELAVPTLAVPTSKREQPLQSSISGVSSAVSAAAGKLSSVPIIGPYAKATSIASGAAGDIAKMFGMARPTDITKPTQSKWLSASSMALVQGASLAQKLSLDPQQELTVDPRTLGLPANDEMTFESIANRECWLTTVMWTDLGGPFTTSGASTPANMGALLFVANVTPNLCKFVQTIIMGLTYKMFTPTPSMFVARPFNFWRGTMVYRFRVVASSFHRGNLRVTYDPISPVQALDTNSQMTYMLDIAKSRELVVRVPWCSQYPYLEVADQKHTPLENFAPNTHNAVVNVPFTTFNKHYHNGVIMLAVVNELVAPNVQPAYVMVSSWMEDCEFQNTSQRIVADYPIFLSPTSGPDSNEDITIVKGKASSSMTNICFGERIVSIRSLLKRTTQAYVLYPNTAPATTAQAIRATLPVWPIIGHAQAVYQNQPAIVNYLTYFASAYVMRRGGVRYQVIWDDLTPAGNGNYLMARPAYCSYTRSWDAVSPGTTGAINQSYTLDAVAQVPVPQSRVGMRMKMGNALEGAYIANFSTQERIHEIELPYYSGNRFSLAQYLPTQVAIGGQLWNWTLTQNPAETGFQLWNMVMAATGNACFSPTVYISGAEDLAFFWFQAPPPLYIENGT